MKKFPFTFLKETFRTWKKATVISLALDGVAIIMVSKCNDGHGGDGFYNTIKNASPLQEAMDGILSRSRNETVFD